MKAQAGSRGLWKALDGCAVANASFRESRAPHRPTAATPLYSSNSARSQPAGYMCAGVPMIITNGCPQAVAAM